MKVIRIVPFLLAALVATAASAAPLQIVVPAEVSVPMSAQTHAEVVADFYVWRAAGLQQLTNGNESPDTQSVRYKQAWSKYQYLRKSPQFQTLVEQLMKDPNTKVSFVTQ